MAQRMLSEGTTVAAVLYYGQEVQIAIDVSVEPWRSLATSLVKHVIVILENVKDDFPADTEVLRNVLAMIERQTASLN